ncbi:MAG: ATP-binding protein [Candidatus Caenarcaniphilales bacterium]|nr:ATP-binding protein [Candidatus Caenarcaniphilales bacterium]
MQPELDIKELQKNIEILKESNRDLEQFAYVVSHDLNEPLRTVKSFCEILSRRYSSQLDDSGKEFMGYIVDGCDRMQNLINDLLQYSRACSKEMVFEELETESLINNSLKNLDTLINEKNAQIIIATDLPKTILGHKTSIEQVFQNLLSNAIKFCQEKPLVKIHYELNSNNQHQFTVIDNGIGIAEENFERVFMVFQRLHSKEEYPGSGIGLSLCKKIIQRHQGQIWLESSLGKGSKMTFTLDL